jgi:septum formation topological specificity factor MinE
MQPELFGQCSELNCSETAVRLFDCAHHCMKQICLQHLIEHDRMIEYNQDYFNNLRTDLLQLWSTYSSLIDETKLQFEFEQKLKKHQQLIREISNLFEINSINIEQYRIMMEKLKQNIEQEKQSNQYVIESFPCIEEVKLEPTEFISTNDELGRIRSYS